MHEIKLTVILSDGRVLSGTYPYMAALERLKFARSLPTFRNFSIKRA